MKINSTLILHLLKTETSKFGASRIKEKSMNWTTCMRTLEICIDTKKENLYPRVCFINSLSQPKQFQIDCWIKGILLTAFVWLHPGMCQTKCLIQILQYNNLILSRLTVEGAYDNKVRLNKWNLMTLINSWIRSHPQDSKKKTISTNWAISSLAIEPMAY